MKHQDRMRKRRIRRKLAHAQGGSCFYCGAPFGPELPATFDHVVPKCRGGETARRNGVAACERCNSDKGDLSQEEFLALRQHPEQLARVRQARGLLKGGLSNALFGQAPR